MLEMQEHSPKYETIKRERIDDPHLLVIDIADLHIGKLADEFDLKLYLEQTDES